MNKQNQKGFTLLELMVTVAIVGILAAIAIPIYNNYITKTRIAEALTHGRVYAGKVTIDREDPVDPPAHLEHSKIELAGSEENPRVRIKLKETIDSRVLIDPDEWAGGKVIVLSEQSSDASVRWACTTNLPQALVPEGCTYEEGVGQRKLLAKWTKGNEACWSPERFARGKGGWAVGSCTNCNQKAMQRKAGRERSTPGYANTDTRVLWEWGATCSGQYGAGEVVLSTDIGAPWQNVPVDERKTVTACWDRAYANDERDGLWVVGTNNVPAGQEKLLRLSADRGYHVGFGFELSCQYCKATEAYCVEGAFAEEEAAEEARLAEEEEEARLAAADIALAALIIASGESTDGIPWAALPEKERETYPSCWNGANNRWEVGSNYCDSAVTCTVDGKCGDRNPCIKYSRKRANKARKPNVGDEDPYLHCQIEMH